MKFIKVKNKSNDVIFKSIGDDDYIENHIPSIESNFGKPERWVRAKVLMENGDPNEPEHWMWLDEYYDEADVLETEERESNRPVPDGNGMQVETWVKLKAEYTIEIEDYRPVPQSITPRQARLALNHFNLRQAVETAVASADQNVKDEWEFANEIKRDWATLVQLATALNLTSEQIDDIFIYGATL